MSRIFQFNCSDCLTAWPGIFMVQNSLWLSVCTKREVLCFQCFSKRLGRLPTEDELTPAPCNDLFRFLYTNLRLPDGPISLKVDAKFGKAWRSLPIPKTFAATNAQLARNW